MFVDKGNHQCISINGNAFEVYRYLEDNVPQSELAVHWCTRDNRLWVIHNDKEGFNLFNETPVSDGDVIVKDKEGYSVLSQKGYSYYLDLLLREPS